MPAIKSLMSKKRNYLILVTLISFVAILLTAFNLKEGDNLTLARREILMRRIGHELLLKSGDSLSRVLPVKVINQNEYQISFEKALTFKPDELVEISKSVLAKDSQIDDYVVEVLDNQKTGVVYGYAIAQNKKQDIISCKGRVQPSANYIISIKVEAGGLSHHKKVYLLSSLPFLALMGFLFLKSSKPDINKVETKSDDKIEIGNLVFDVKNRLLLTEDHSIELTKTETRVLLIFAKAPNEIIERNRLQKEIWEDDGVIVGRSLDMFISKLRKKLECDSSIELTVIRSKGYKLAIAN